MPIAFIGLDKDLEDPIVHSDNSAAAILMERLEAESYARDRELDEMIAMGWGDTPAKLIPPDWRTRRGVDNTRTTEIKAKMSHRIRAARQKRKQIMHAVAS